MSENIVFDPSKCNHSVYIKEGGALHTFYVQEIDCPHCLRFQVEKQKGQIEHLQNQIQDFESIACRSIWTALNQFRVICPLQKTACGP